jgi:hypothetical protein
VAHVSGGGTIAVRTVAIDSLPERGKTLPPRVMKIDVEGAELESLRGAARTIKTHRPTILLATHGPNVHDGCVKFSRDRRYVLGSLTDAPVEVSAEILARAEQSSRSGA